MTEETKPSGIHAAMLAAMAQIAATGIAKDKSASLGGTTVKFRGIEAAMNQMSGVLITCGITVTPRYRDLQVADRVRGEPKDGKWTRCVTLLGQFTFSATDGSSYVCEAYGEANDTGDKAVVKAQSIAFRTALFQQFVVPTMAIDPEDDDSGDNDLLSEARTVARNGTDAYTEFFTKVCSKADRAALKDHHESLKQDAAAADRIAAEGKK